MEKNIYQIRGGFIHQNTFLISLNNNSIIIDPGLNSKEVIEYFENSKLKPIAILLTHYHFDHSHEINILEKKYNIKTYISNKDFSFLLKDTLSGVFKLEKTIIDEKNILFFEEKMKIDDFDLEILETPGHSEGSVCIKWDDNIFTGDTIFYNTIGRTDIPGSDKLKMKKTLELIFNNFKENYHIYPGHGNSDKWGNISKRIKNFLEDI
ncbi:MAG: MBL fold metallo-hydrolase [Mycoplasma sp.]|nr:MBL fold metallo-hydrolase [Mycoplasma sp.]